MSHLKRLLAPMLGAFLLFGCATPGEKLAEHTCVMMPGEPVYSDSRTAEFEGETVYFCCGSCARKWEQKSDDEKRQLVADMQAQLQK